MATGPDTGPVQSNNLLRQEGMLFVSWASAILFMLFKQGNSQPTSPVRCGWGLYYADFQAVNACYR